VLPPDCLPPSNQAQHSVFRRGVQPVLPGLCKHTWLAAHLLCHRQGVGKLRQVWQQARLWSLGFRWLTVRCCDDQLLCSSTELEVMATLSVAIR